ncbi:2514_t:CDS:2 [Funneliformis geosporum]|uniref:2514_t:CDS:1 n=1 Tax=Funneliformis geosporum TaxID=1117311 RepID=A0A9W4T103_9GLOM|nr:2514_t:CDS:2 [Funneliformis geosporum]
MNNDKNKVKFTLNLNSLKRPRTRSVNTKEKKEEATSESQIRPLFPNLPSVLITPPSAVKITACKIILPNKIVSKETKSKVITLMAIVQKVMAQKATTLMTTAQKVMIVDQGK